MPPLLVSEIAYTVPLALWDLVPVALACAAWLTVAVALADRGTKLRSVAVVGALLITFGGACKAGWKLIRASSGTDIPGIDDMLFPALAAGFALVSASLIARRVQSSTWTDIGVAGDRAAALGVPIAGGVVVGVSLAIRSKGLEDGAGLLLPIVVVASMVAIGMLIAWARQREDTGAMIAMIVHLVLTLGLGYLGTIDEQTTTLQWIEETTNVINQGALLVAARRLLAHTRPAEVAALHG